MVYKNKRVFISFFLNKMLYLLCDKLLKFNIFQLFLNYVLIYCYNFLKFQFFYYYYKFYATNYYLFTQIVFFIKDPKNFQL